MKREYDFYFLVNHDVIDISEHTGKPANELERLSSSEIKDLYVSMLGKLNSGEIKVSSEYYEEPKYYCLPDDSDMISATFEARLTLTAEGKDKAECDENARMAYYRADLGDYYFNHAYEYNCTSREIKTMELENAKYEKEKTPECISYVINPNEFELTKLVKNTEYFQEASEDVKQSMLNDVKELYKEDVDMELAAQYAVTAIGYKNSLEIYVGGDRVSESYNAKSLYAQHQKEWNAVMKETTDKQINPEDVINKLKDFKKEMEGITASKLQARKEKEEIVNDIFNKKITEDIKEIYPVIDALAAEIEYDAAILQRVDWNTPSPYNTVNKKVFKENEKSYHWFLDFKQKDEIIGSEGSSGTLLVIQPTNAADINSSTAIYADKTTVTIPDTLKTEDVAMNWQNAKEDILCVVADKIDSVLRYEKTALDKMKKGNQNLKENVLKDTIERN